MEKLIILCIFFLAGLDQGFSINSLYKGLFDYVSTHSDGPDLPPVYEINQEVTVHVQMQVSGIYNVDRIRNELDLSVMIAMSWQAGISWAPDKFNGLDSITVPRSMVWYPHIAIKNAVSGYDDLAPARTTIRNDGETWTMNHFHLKVSCDLREDDKCILGVILSTHGNKLVHLKAATDEVKKLIDFTSFFNESSDGSSPFQIKESSMTSSSYAMAGVPGRKERVEIEFSFRDQYRRFSRFPTAMFSWQ